MAASVAKEANHHHLPVAWWQALSPPECHRHERARTLTPSPPRTVWQPPQACSISRSFMAASVAKEANHLHVPDDAWRQSISPPECQRQRRARTLTPPPQQTVGQPQAQASQSELHDGFRCKRGNPPACRCLVPGDKHFPHRSANSRDEQSKYLDSPSASHRTAAAIVLDSISRSFMAASVAKETHHLWCKWCRGISGKHSPPECQRQRRARTLTPPPPRTVRQPQACTISRGFMAASIAKEAHHLPAHA